MSADDYHVLLRRQLRKHFRERAIPDDLRGLLELVDEAYRQADDDRSMLERAFELSSEELLDANAGLADALEELALAKTRAEEANQAKDDFLAVLSHELRNPLAPLVTALDAAKLRGTYSIDGRDIERPLRQVVRLVDDLLDVARTERGMVVLDKRPQEISVAIRDALEAVRPLMDLRGHSLEVDVAKAGLLVDGDVTRLVQVVANLLTNAARYTPPGGRIVVRAFRDRLDVVIAVEDNGQGIHPADLSRVFGSFVRDRQRPLGLGLGLGLTLVHNMVSLHGGTVRVTSEGKGRGSTFEVRIPLFVGDAAGDEGDGPGAARLSCCRRKVLVVDDNRDAAELLAMALRDAGHDVMMAFDPHEALALLSEFAPDVAVLDVGLPGMTGHELGGLLIERCARAPKLIALTGYGRAEDHAESARAGFSAHLVKPVSLGELLAVIAC